MLLVCVSGLDSGTCIAQSTLTRPSFSIHKATDAVKIDAALDEASWKNAEKIDQLMQQFPYDTSRSKLRTEFRATYDDNFIYIAAICHDDIPDKDYVIQSLKRDYSYPVTDGFGVYFDPFNDKSNGFAFTCNPFG